MTLPAASDLARCGIWGSTVVLGLIHTSLFEALPGQAYQSLKTSVCYPQRLGKAEDIAYLSVFVAKNDYKNALVSMVLTECKLDKENLWDL